MMFVVSRQSRKAGDSLIRLIVNYSSRPSTKAGRHIGMVGRSHFGLFPEFGAGILRRVSPTASSRIILLWTEVTPS